MTTDVYQIVTDRILQKLEAGIVPWRMGWQQDNRLPMNLISGKEYQGINTLLLWSCRYNSPHWMTYRQCQELGGNVRKGEKSCPIVFWKFVRRLDTEGNKVEFPVLRYYSVFNLAQTEGIPDSKLPESPVISREFSPIEQAEQIVAGWKNRPLIEWGHRQALYSPSRDCVEMPDPSSFDTAEFYYSVLFHELTHSTGHCSRLNRGLKGPTDQQEYGREELIAEMGAAFLNAVSGIEPQTEEQSTAYLAGWIKTIKSDTRALVVAAGAAQKAVNMIREISLEPIEQRDTIAGESNKSVVASGKGVV